MKAFVISLIVIVGIFALTIANSILINNVTSVLIEQASALELGDGSIEQFSNLWYKKQIIIRMTSSHEETHKIDEVLSILDAKDKEGNCADLQEERALLVEYLLQIKEDETITFDNII